MDDNQVEHCKGPTLMSPRVHLFAGIEKSKVDSLFLFVINDAPGNVP